MSYQCKFVIKNLRDRMGHVRKQTLNYKVGKYWELLGVPIARNPCRLAGGSRLHSPAILQGLMCQSGAPAMNEFDPPLHQKNPKFTFCTFFTCCKQKKYRFWKVPPT
jgi:hypothetical protein